MTTNKFTIILIAFMFTAIPVIAQNTDPCYEQKNPLNLYAFKKMMRDHYNFTILGTQSPTTGFKIETSKPSITLKGNIFAGNRDNEYLKKYNPIIINLELTGGLQDDLMQLFSGDKLNGYFKASLGFNYLFKSGNNGKFMVDEFTRKISRKTVCQYREEIALQIDSFLVMQVLEKEYANPSPSSAVALDSIIKLAGVGKYTLNGYIKRPIIDTPAYYKKLLSGMLEKYGADTSKTLDSMYLLFINKFKSNTDSLIHYSKLSGDLKRLSKFKNPKHKYDLFNDFEIAVHNEVWTSKRISWLNVSLGGINASFKMYDAIANTITDSHSFLPSITFTYNFFKKWTPANKYFYIRTGASLRRVNSLPDLPKFDYKKGTIISVSPTEELKSEKSGTAYQGELKHGTGFDIPVELYWTPWEKVVIPGIYTKLLFSYGSAWINKSKLGLDLGIIWNVTNNDKDSKNVLTIIPYVNWSNFLKEYKEVSKVTKKELSDLFSVGVKFGIPVNIGK